MIAGFVIVILGLVLPSIALIVRVGDDDGDSFHRWKQLNETDRECTHCGRIKREHCRDYRRACPISWEVLNEGAGPICSGDE